MAHTDDGLIYSSPTEGGVSIDDIRAVLGEDSGDLGTLCTSDRINPIAKYKPLRGGDWRTTLLGDTELWRGPGAVKDCGLQPNQMAQLADIPAAYADNDPMHGWKYLKPDGTNWKRQTDFDGYDRNAAMADIRCGSTALTTEKAFPVVLIEYRVERWLRLEDIGAIADGYLGIYAVPTYGETPFYATAQKTIAETGQQDSESGEPRFGMHEATIDWSNKDDTWTLYPIICMKPKTQGGDNPAGQVIYAIPYVSPRVVTVSESSSAMYVRGNVIQTGQSTLRVTLHAVNATAHAVDFGTVYWRLQTGEATNSPVLRQGEWTNFGADGNGHIGGDDSDSVTIDLNGCSDIISLGSVWLRVYSGGGASGIGGECVEHHFKRISDDSWDQPIIPTT